MSSNLGRRIAFSVIAIPAVLAVLYLGGWALAALLGALGVLGTWEFYGLAKRMGVYPFVGLGLFAALAIPLLAYVPLSYHVERLPCFVCPAPWSGGLLAAVWLMAVFAAALRVRGPADRPLGTVALTVLGPLYASGLLAFVLVLRHGSGAPTKSWPALWVAALPLVLTWICDTAAMAAGKAIGGRQLAPVVSPNKTWAGAIAGTVAAILAALAYGRWVLGRFDLQPGVLQLAVLGLVVAVAAQVGDVAESLVKREAGVKDSSALIPGHGGVLDRLDALYFVVPAATALYTWFAFV